MSWVAAVMEVKERTANPGETSGRKESSKFEVDPASKKSVVGSEGREVRNFLGRRRACGGLNGSRPGRSDGTAVQSSTRNPGKESHGMAHPFHPLPACQPCTHAPLSMGMTGMFPGWDSPFSAPSGAFSVYTANLFFLAVLFSFSSDIAYL